MNKLKTCIPFIFLLLSVSLFFRCGNKSSQQSKDDLSSEVDEIQLPASHNYKHNLKFSDIVEDVQYIPLETTPDGLLGDASPPILSGDFMFIEFRGVIFQFDRQGTFLRKINTVGQGPYECRAKGFTIDEKRELIYILDDGKLNVYVFDFMGNTVKIIENPFREGYEPGAAVAAGILCDEKGNLIWHFEYLFGIMKYKYVVTSRQNGMIAKNENYDLYRSDRKLYTYWVNTPFYTYDKKTYYTGRFNDTVFRINDDYSASVGAIIRLAKRLTPEEYIKAGTGETDKTLLSDRMSFIATREELMKISGNSKKDDNQIVMIIKLK